MGLDKKLSEHGKWIDVDVDQMTDQLNESMRDTDLTIIWETLIEWVY
jgi:hypothetical protein